MLGAVLCVIQPNDSGQLFLQKSTSAVDQDLDAAVFLLERYGTVQ